jgi:hypothetical protein
MGYQTIKIGDSALLARGSRRWLSKVFPQLDLKADTPTHELFETCFVSFRPERKVQRDVGWDPNRHSGRGYLRSTTYPVQLNSTASA